MRLGLVPLQFGESADLWSQVPPRLPRGMQLLKISLTIMRQATDLLKQKPELEAAVDQSTKSIIPTMHDAELTRHVTPPPAF